MFKVIAALLCLSPCYAFAIGEATYDVPVPERLAPYSQYELKDFSIEIHGDEVEIEYKLPTILFGREQLVKYKGSKADFLAGKSIGGSHAVAKCAFGSANLVRCEAQYYGMDVNLPGVRSALEVLNLPQQEFEGRFETAMIMAELMRGFFNFEFVQGK